MDRCLQKEPHLKNTNAVLGCSSCDSNMTVKTDFQEVYVKIEDSESLSDDYGSSSYEPMGHCVNVVKCEECNNQAYQTAMLDSKYSSTHDKNKKRKGLFQCEICKISCTRLWNLKIHMRTHTGEKPFHCTVCQARFAHSGSLRNHSRIHSVEKLYHCHFCTASFIQSGTLRSHIRIHTGEKPYQCQVCQASFAQSGNLRKHMRIHLIDKPVLCQVCHFKFKTSKELKMHMKIHTGENMEQGNVKTNSTKQ